MEHPTHIGRFRVIERVGEGAMGVVFRARDESLDRDVALKVMRSRTASPEDRERFLHEARAVARLQHANIVTLYELGDHEGAPFIAMELLEGVDLQRAIEGGLRPNPRATLPIVLQLLAGLGHAHEHGIVHRDVKPSNVFLPRGRPAKIMDFGVARLGGTASASGLIVGTPNYMSPEQVQAQRVDGRSDLFSAGLILYELVTGEKAYRGDTIVALVYKIAHEDPDLGLIPRGAKWDRLRGVLTRALFKDAERRYPSAAAMSADLELALADLGGPLTGAAASDLGLVKRALAVPLAPSAPPDRAVVEEPAPSVVRTAPHLPRDRRWVVPAAAGVAVLAVAAVTLVAMLFRSSGGSAPVTVETPAAPSSPSPSFTAPPSPAASVSATRDASPAPRASSAAARSVAAATPAAIPTPPPVRPAEAASGNARLDRANTLYEGGHYAAALAEARAVLDRDPRNAEARSLVEDIEVDTQVEARLKQAKEALRRGDRDAALAEVRAGLAAKATDGRLLSLFKELTQ
jgi:eukaryotic-like serine/threonine-protein kinase